MAGKTTKPAKQRPEAMISLFTQAKQDNVNGDGVRDIGRKQTEIARHMSAEIGMDRDVSLDAFLPKGDIEIIEQRRKTRLVTELQNLIKIIDELMIQ